MTEAAARAEMGKFRTQIDNIDVEILGLLNLRGVIAQEIGGIKRRASLPIVEMGRERQVVANMVERNGGPLPPDSVERIFQAIMIEMRNLQCTPEPEAS
ncbi:MAG: chorismate mutase [Acidobacteria bacterium]|nr:chorismate mutase [Acidobacteriota bacterium]